MQVFRVLIVALLLVALEAYSSCCAVADPGHYEVRTMPSGYSGGTNVNSQYGMVGYSYSAYYEKYVGSSFIYWSGDRGTFNGNIVNSGTITTTFTWVPDPSKPNLPTPTAVAIEEYCLAAWNARGTSGTEAAHGDCNNGLGATKDGTYSVPPVYGERCESYKYTVKYNPGTSFQILCSPTSSVVQPLTDKSLQDHATIYYKAKITDIQIFRNGQTVTGQAKKVLAGEPNKLVVGKPGQTSASTVDPIGATDFLWTVQNNADIFSSWEVVENATDPDQCFATLNPVNNFTSSALSFFYSKCAGDRKITCKFKRSDGIEAIAEAVFETNQSTTSDFKQKWGVDNLSDERLDLGIPALGLLPTTPQGILGITWGAIVTIPTGYRPNGEICSAQLVDVDRKYIESDGTIRRHRKNSAGFGLDTSFPYGGAGGLPFSGMTGDYGSGDSPSLSLEGNKKVVIGDGANEQFQTYLMFKPSMAGSAWVPLNKFVWGHGGSAELLGTPAVWTPGAAPNNLRKFKNSWTDAMGNYPTWTFKVLGDDFPDAP